MFGAMGGALPPVVAHLLADISGFSAGMGVAAAEVKKLDSKGAAMFSKMATVGKAAFLGLATAAILVGGASVDMASQFDTQMERIHTLAGASQREVDSLKDKVLAVGYATGQGPVKLAEALYHVESVGYRGAAAMSVLTEASKLATISGASLDDTTYGLTSVMQTYGAKAQDAAKWAAFFNGVVGVGDMKMESFNRAIGTQYFSAAQTFGVSARSAGAALAFITDRGAHADEAATRLRMTLALMAAPSQKAATLLRAIGLKGGEVKASTESMTAALKKAHLTTVALASDLKKPDGLYEALHHLQSALVKSGLSAEAANALLSHSFGGGKSDATILAMLNNLDTLKSKYNALGHSINTYGESWKATTEQFSVKVKRLEAGAEALGIKLGNYLIPKIESLVSWMSKAADWAGRHKTAMEALAIVIGGVLLVAMAAWIASLAVAAAEMVVATWPILLIIAAVALLVVGILWLKAHWSQVWSWVSEKAQAVAKAVSGAWDRVKQWTSEKWHAVTSAIQGAWNAVVSWLKGAWHWATDPIVRGWDWLKAKTTAIWDAVAGFFRKWWPLLLSVFLPWVALIIGAWNHFHTAVWAKVTSVWSAVTSWLSGIWNRIKTGAQVAWNFVYQHIVQPIERAVAWVRAKIGAVASFLSTEWGRIKSATSAGFLAIYHFIADPIGKAYTWVATKVGQIKDKLVSGIQDAKSALWSVGSWFADIGSAIVHGIISGINNMGGSLFGSLEHLATGALNAAKSVLGINSPSKVFAAVVGHSIPEGVAYGVREKAHLASNAVAVMAGGLPGGVSPFALAGAGARGAGSGGGVDLNLNVEAKVDGKALFSITQKGALRYEKSNGRPAFQQ